MWRNKKIKASKSLRKQDRKPLDALMIQSESIGRDIKTEITSGFSPKKNVLRSEETGTEAQKLINI